MWLFLGQPLTRPPAGGGRLKARHSVNVRSTSSPVGNPGRPCRRSTIQQCRYRYQSESSSRTALTPSSSEVLPAPSSNISPFTRILRTPWLAESSPVPDSRRSLRSREGDGGRIGNDRAVRSERAADYIAGSLRASRKSSHALAIRARGVLC